MKYGALPVDVEGSHYLWKGHICSDRPWDANLVNGKVWVGSDNGSSREIDTFPHQVSSDSSFLSLQSLLQGLKRAPGLLHGLRE